MKRRHVGETAECTVNFQCPIALRSELQALAASRERSVSAELRLAATDWLNRHRPPARQQHRREGAADAGRVPAG
jgi:hypothetical protein